MYGTSDPPNSDIMVQMSKIGPVNGSFVAEDIVMTGWTDRRPIECWVTTISAETAK